MLSIALTTFALTVRDTPTATPALRLRGGVFALCCRDAACGHGPRGER